MKVLTVFISSEERIYYPG